MKVTMFGTVDQRPMNIFMALIGSFTKQGFQIDPFCCRISADPGDFVLQIHPHRFIDELVTVAPEEKHAIDRPD